MEIGTLENGVTYCLRKRADVSSVSFQIWISSGSSHEDEKTRGISHFIEHMVFNGTENHPPGYIESVIENLGGDINAATSYDYTYYYVHIPSKHLRTSVELLSELVTKPKFSNEMVEKEKEIVLEEIARSKDDPKEFLWETYLSNLYQELPYRYPILGYRETVSKFTAETLREFYNQTYTPKNIFAVICGNFKVEEAKELLEDNLGKLRRNRTFKKLKNPNEKHKGREITLKHPSVVNPQVMVGWKLRENSILYEILESLLSSGRSSLLYQRLKERGISYLSYANYQNFIISPNFYIYSITENIDRLLEELEILLSEVQSITEDEFNFAKEKLYKAEIFDRESVASEAESIGYSLSVYKDVNYYKGYFKNLARFTFNDFLKSIEFLKQKPLVVKLLPE